MADYPAPAILLPDLVWQDSEFDQIPNPVFGVAGPQIYAILPSQTDYLLRRNPNSIVKHYLSSKIQFPVTGK